MGFCIRCNEEIEDGIELCDDCANINDKIQDESYLDDLLNSVINPNSNENYDVDEQSEDMIDLMDAIEDEDVFNSTNVADIFADIDGSDIFADIEDDDMFNDILQEEDDILLGLDDSNISYDSNGNVPIMSDGDVQYDFSDEDSDINNDDMPYDMSGEDSDTNNDDISYDISNDDIDINDINDINTSNDESDIFALDDMDVSALSDMDISTETEEGEETYADDLSNGLDELDMLGDSLMDTLADTDISEDMSEDMSGDAITEPEISPEEDELSSLLGGMVFDDLGLDENIMAADDSAGTYESNEEEHESEDDLMEMLKMSNEEAIPVGESEEVGYEADLLEAIPERVKKEKKEKKPGILFKLFGNVKTDESKKKPAKPKKSKKKDEEGEEGEEKVKLTKEEKKKLKEEEKKLKAEKKKAGGDDAEDGDSKKKEKKAKKEKPKKEPEEIIEEDEGEINKVGATIVFMFFATIGAVIVIGTNVFSYSTDIDRASKYFSSNNYTLAYEEIIGMEVEQKDEKLYDKICAVMTINRYYDSYINYTLLNMYPEALDALITGINKHDKAIIKYKDLNIKEHLNYVKADMVKALETVFNVNEDYAKELGSVEDSDLYTKSIKKITDKITK